jgi:hypothetical protein
MSGCESRAVARMGCRPRPWRSEPGVRFIMANDSPPGDIPAERADRQVRAEMVSSPNPRLQRTRVRSAGGRSPLSRKPLGRWE